jgi:hypothetical protein
VLREPSNSRDKWITFMDMLLESWQTQSYFPYTVELKLRNGEVYGSDLLGLSKNTKDHQEWILAHEIVDIAIQTNK